MSIINMNGIIKDGKHSYKDFGLIMQSRSIGLPSKRKIYDSVPYLSGNYDFSLLYGEQSYDERTLNYVFTLKCKDEYVANSFKVKIVNWLLDGNKKKLVDDETVGYYFMAECTGCICEQTGCRNSTLKFNVTFTAYPFLISDKEEGDTIWDTFCFATDSLQKVKFNITDSKDIVLCNVGVSSVTPTVVCDSFMNILQDGITYVFNPGSTEDYRFSLKKGRNNITVKGTGSIEFKFRKEVL